MCHGTGVSEGVIAICKYMWHGQKALIMIKKTTVSKHHYSLITIMVFGRFLTFFLKDINNGNFVYM